MVAMAVKSLAHDMEKAMAGFGERLGAMEATCKRLTQAAAEAQESQARAQEDALAELGRMTARMDGFEHHMRDVLRGVQLMRDKQELREAQKDLKRAQIEKEEEIAAVAAQEAEEAAAAAAAAAAI